MYIQYGQLSNIAPYFNKLARETQSFILINWHEKLKEDFYYWSKLCLCLLMMSYESNRNCNRNRPFLYFNKLAREDKEDFNYWSKLCLCLLRILSYERFLISINAPYIKQYIRTHHVAFKPSQAP